MTGGGRALLQQGEHRDLAWRAGAEDQVAAQLGSGKHVDTGVLTAEPVRRAGMPCWPCPVSSAAAPPTARPSDAPSGRRRD